MHLKHVSVNQTLYDLVTEDEILSLEGRKANAENLYMYKEATPGPVVTVDDAVTEAVKQMKIAIEPVQDLHGYANPWPGGGGINKLNVDLPIVLSEAGQIGRKDCILPAGTYTFTSKTNATAAYSLTVYNSSGTKITTANSATASANPLSVTFTLTEESAYIMCYYNAACTITDMQIEAGTSFSGTFVPYSNICPISGWTGCKVIRTGKNLLHQNFVQNGANQVLLNGYLVESGDNKVCLKGGTTYTISFKRPTDKPFGLYCSGDNTAAKNLFPSHLKQLSVQFTPDKSDNFTFWAYYPNGVSTTDISDAMIEIGSMATEYTPFVANDIYQIDFPETVYSGELTVNADGTGTLVVDKFLYVYDGTESFSKSGTALNGFYNNLLNSTPPHGWPKMANYTLLSITDERSSIFIPTRNTATYQNNYGYVYFDTGHNFNVPAETFGTTVDSFKAKLAELYAAGTPVSVFCKILQPVTYTLTAIQVQTIMGLNHIWADCGDIKSLLYATNRYYDKEESDERYVPMANIATLTETQAMIDDYYRGEDT